MNISAHGLQFVAGWEGLRNRLYDDGGPGAGNCTIGVGHLVHLGPCDGRADEQPFLGGLSDEQCYALLREDAQRFVTFVNRQATVPLTQPQFDALVDFSFNTGGGYPAVWAAVNGGGDVCAVLRRTAILPAWATAALVRRREAECRLYHETYGPDAPVEEVEMKIAPFWTGKPFGAGRWDINLHADFGPAAAYNLCVVLAPGTQGSVVFMDGGFVAIPEGRLSAGQARTFVVVPGQFGTAPFDVVGAVKFAYVACAGSIKP